MACVVIVQQIRTEWTKASRGGTGAVRRNTVSKAVKVPLHQVKQEGLILLHHTVSFNESDNFSRPEETFHINPSGRPLPIGCVSVDYDQEAVAARFAYNGACGGAPDRHGLRTALTPALNEWCQIVYNGRFAGEDYWWYEKRVVNVGMFDSPFNGVFTRSKPHQRYASLARLF